uniref:Uncharacterized protein n=1 Tax=Rhizophora mucronata TaxID=61149 RepID=A0A2P2M214_RHIMU
MCSLPHRPSQDKKLKKQKHLIRPSLQEQIFSVKSYYFPGN